MVQNPPFMNTRFVVLTTISELFRRRGSHYFYFIYFHKLYILEMFEAPQPCSLQFEEHILPSPFLQVWNQPKIAHAAGRNLSLPLWLRTTLTTTPPWLLLNVHAFLFHVIFFFQSGNKLKELVLQAGIDLGHLSSYHLSQDHYTTLAIAESSCFFILSKPFLPL